MNSLEEASVWFVLVFGVGLLAYMVYISIRNSENRIDTIGNMILGLVGALFVMVFLMYVAPSMHEVETPVYRIIIEKINE